MSEASTFVCGIVSVSTDRVCLGSFLGEWGFVSFLGDDGRSFCGDNGLSLRGEDGLYLPGKHMIICNADK